MFSLRTVTMASTRSALFMSPGRIPPARGPDHEHMPWSLRAVYPVDHADHVLHGPVTERGTEPAQRGGPGSAYTAIVVCEHSAAEAGVRNADRRGRLNCP